VHLHIVSKSNIVSAPVRTPAKYYKLCENSGGGHFYTPFWSDVKLHVQGIIDLKKSTQERVEKGTNKKNLYPLLERGFLNCGTDLINTGVDFS